MSRHRPRDTAIREPCGAEGDALSPAVTVVVRLPYRGDRVLAGYAPG